MCSSTTHSTADAGAIKRIAPLFFPAWRSFSGLAQLFRPGAAFPAWRSFSGLAQLFRPGAAFPAWRSFSGLAQRPPMCIIALPGRSSRRFRASLISPL